MSEFKKWQLNVSASACIDRMPFIYKSLQESLQKLSDPIPVEYFM